MTRSGFVALAGRPNVGKSTFLNRVVGQRVAIVSDHAQTTRRAIRGVHRTDDVEIVLVDLPGVQRPRDALTKRMASRVEQELRGADAALLMVNGEQRIGAGDRRIARTIADAGMPATIAVNKVDRLSPEGIAGALLTAAELNGGAEVFPISARSGEGIEALLTHLGRQMPDGPFMFGEDALPDQPLELRAAELVREAVIRRTFHELPHAVEVIVEEVEQVRAGLMRVRALIWVESESQKAIVIGAAGRMIKAIGTSARAELEAALGSHVHLDLSVRVRRSWRSDEALLDRLGIT